MSDLTNLKKQVNKLPERPGIYQFKDSQNHILYIGKALSLKDRLESYFQTNVSSKTSSLLQKSQTVDYIETGSEFAALLLEARLIKKYLPKYNLVLRDDKSYLYIFISSGEEYPKVFVVRKLKISGSETVKTRWEIYQDLKGKYYGPFPSAKNTYELVKWLRHIIPFCQQRGFGKKSCFYKHLGLCNPCPSEIIRLSGREKQKLRKIYLNNIFRLKNLLDGNFEKVRNGLIKEMNMLSKACQFEAASTIRDRIKYLEYLLNRNLTHIFLENPNFIIESRESVLGELRNLLLINNISTSKLTRIEGYDVSNISGKFAAASLVVFINGLPEKKYYRRFKILLSGKADDVAMLKEAVGRRFKHSEWNFPDLILIDGGKPQVITIVNLLNKIGLNIPVIGLAKKEEIIIFYTNNQFKQIKLNANQQALILLEHIRDETHRFAINYHRYLRNRILTEIN